MAADEIRCRRLVVEDDEGNERIVLEVNHGVAEVRVTMADGAGTATLVAGSVEELGSIVGLHIAGDGDGIAEILARRDEDGHWVVEPWHEVEPT